MHGLVSLLILALAFGTRSLLLDPSSSSASPSSAAPEKCVREVRVAAVKKSSEACWIDAPSAGAAGTFNYACEGGQAEVRIGKYAYRGSVKDGVLEYSLKTEFDWSDGCHWKSEQHLQGSVDGPLQYSYREMPVSGKSCLSACSAQGTYEVGR